MANDNIYDLAISELILGGSISGSGLGSGVSQLTLTNSLGTNEVHENFNDNTVTYTSVVSNLPTGYSVKANSHRITHPGLTPTEASTSTTTGPAVNVIVGLVGTTPYTVSSTVTLEHSTSADIVLVATNVVSPVLPGYVGVKEYNANPDIAGLSKIASTDTSFQLTNSSVNRLYIVLPVTYNALLSVTSNNGLTYPVSEDFTSTTVGSFTYYILKYNTQFTGTNLKRFTFNFS